MVVVAAVLMGSGNTHRGDLSAQSNDFEVFLKAMLCFSPLLIPFFSCSAFEPKVLLGAVCNRH